MVKKVTEWKGRNIAFDLLRIVLTFLVVNIHIRVISRGPINFLESYGYYSVPLFMTLSFFLMNKYLSQNKLSFSIIWRRIQRLLFPLIFWSAIGFLLKPNLINIRNVCLQFFTGKVVDTPLYYLNILICLTFIFWLITYLPSKYRVPLYISIVMIAIILEYTGINTHYFNLTIVEIRKSYGQIVELIKYASLGMLFGILINQNRKQIILFSLVGSTLFLLSVFKFPQPWGYNYSGLKLFLGTIFVLSSVLLIGPINFSEKIKKTIHIIGGYSFGVYLCHIIFFEALLKTFPDIKYLNNLFPFQFLFIYTLGCFAFCYFFDLLTFKKFSFLVK
ncbi:MAG: acyltransferase [Patescibacteria group bacterium]|jgi:peptidoglycan/LPS O-acetylase OafA/YrhL